MSVNTNPVLGVVIIARHGDRLGFFQDPDTYTAIKSGITPLGEVQEYQLGAMLRRIYADPASETAIVDLSPEVVVASQLSSTADGGGSRASFDSAVALWQGFYPPAPALSTITLANGTDITSPLGGYQYLQIDALLPEVEIDLESYTNCEAWANHTDAFYDSTEFAAKDAESAGLLELLRTSGLVGNRTVSLTNMWNIFDFMNVQNIHDAAYAKTLAAAGVDIIPQVRHLANWHQHRSFTSSTPGGIGNVAGQTLFPLITDALLDMAKTSVVKIAHFQTAYKPFLSLMNMTDVASDALLYPEGIVDYASVATFELRENMAGTGHDVRFGFLNGTTDGAFGSLSYHSLFGSNSLDTDLTTLVSTLEPFVLSNITAWCNACGNTIDSGCDLVYLANVSAQAALDSHTHAVGPVRAGFIGAGVTLGVGVVALGVLVLLGMASFGSRSGRSGRRAQDGVHLTRTKSVAGSF